MSIIRASGFAETAPRKHVGALLRRTKGGLEDGRARDVQTGRWLLSSRFERQVDGYAPGGCIDMKEASVTKYSLRRGMVALLALVALVAASCGDDGGSDGGGAAPDDTSPAGDLDSLVEAAKKDGEVVWLTNNAEAHAQKIAAAFTEEYGIPVNFLALNTAPLSQRYQSEAQAGNISVDVLTVSNSTEFLRSTMEQGWTESLESANLPVMEDGDFPEEFNFDFTATVGVAPFMLWWNTDRVKEPDAPKSFEDLTQPKYRGLISFADPQRDAAFASFFMMLHEEYGEDWFKAVRANEPKVFPSAASTIQAVAAGDGAIGSPALNSVGQALLQNNAPIKGIVPPTTTGPEYQIMLTARDKARNPNAARLFANWMLSKSGNEAVWSGGAGVSVYDSTAVPEGWVTPPVVTAEDAARMSELLGF